MATKTVCLLSVLVCICASVAGQDRRSVWQSRMDAGRQAVAKQQYDEAERQFVDALKEAEPFGAGDPRLVQTLNSLAGVYRSENKYAEAEAVYLRALSLDEALYGPEHESLVGQLTNLAEFYYAQPSRSWDAEQAMVRAIKIQEKCLGPESPEVSFNLIQLGYWYGLAGKDSEAEALLLRALSIQEKTYGKEAAVLNTGLTYLAAIRARQRRLGEVERLYLQVQDLLEKSIVTKDAATGMGQFGFSKEEERLQNARLYAARLRNLTSFYGAQRRFVDAEAQYQHALKVLEQEFGAKHFTVGMVLEAYAVLLRRTNRVAEAESMETRAKAISEANTRH